MTRPEREAPPDGFKWEAVPADSDWRLATSLEASVHKCRGIRGCRGWVIIALLRSFRHWKTGQDDVRWYYYCADHTYGRWLEDDKIMQWRLVEDE